MTHRENLLRLFRRQGYEFAPVDFFLCPSLEREFERRTGQTDYGRYYEFSSGGVWGLGVEEVPQAYYRGFFRDIPPGSGFDHWGILYEPNENSYHMTRMHHPLREVETLAELEAYRFPRYIPDTTGFQKDMVRELHDAGLAAVGSMECTVWETSWYLRSMEELMMDMASDDEKATFLLDKVTELAVIQAVSFARAGVDILKMGDDVGMQHSIMMDPAMYRKWLKPRLKKIIDAAKTEKPDILVQYHSCGYVEPFIEDFIESGVDILNPVQTECMSFADLHARFGNRLSFSGTIGTQSTMPHGTPDEVSQTVRANLETAGEKGGLLCCPTHMLEPEVPFDNVEAYIQACKAYRPGKG